VHFDFIGQYFSSSVTDDDLSLAPLNYRSTFCSDGTNGDADFAVGLLIKPQLP
jgi:hypothetical protein